MQIGIQLYTVRDACTEDFTGTLEALAKMGYDALEFAWNYGGMAPDELARFLNGLGLSCCGLHASVDDILNPGSAPYAYAAAIGSPYVTTSLAGEVAEQWPQAILNVGRAAAVAHGRGVAFTYHNHVQEFETVDGVFALDKLYAETDPALVGAELDTHYIKRGGADPATYIRQHAPRVRQVHMKDLAADGQSHTEVGSGLLDIPGILRAAQDTGVDWIIVEQECDFAGGSAIESARISLDGLRAAAETVEGQK